MKHTMVWFGRMTHGELSIGYDEYRIIIINSIDERVIMNPDDVDEYLDSKNYDSYLIPDEFDGEVVFSKAFFKGLSE